MWKVVGFKCRDSEKGRFYDVFLQRECSAPGVGLECMRGDFSARRCSYVPELNDIVAVSMDSYNGRRYISEIYKVG